MFDYTANMKKTPNQNQTENTVRRFLLFTCTSGKRVQDKRGSTLIIHTVFAGVMWQQVETKTFRVFWGTTPQHKVSHSRGPASVLQMRSEVRSGAKGGSERAAGTHDEPQLLPLHLRLGGFPTAQPHG